MGGNACDHIPVASWSARQRGLTTMRRTLGQLTTKRGRSVIAVAVRHRKGDIRRDLGGDLTRAQETLPEAAAQACVILSSLDEAANE
jgi:hypothetical protein